MSILRADWLPLRRHCVLLCAVLAVLVVSGVMATAVTECTTSEKCYTEVQRMSTYVFLNQIGKALGLTVNVPDFCSTAWVRCTAEGAEVDLSSPTITHGDISKLTTVNEHTLVTAINFNGQSGISGTLPLEWGQLPRLRSLSAASTSIGGTLPSEWSGLATLETLDLSNTQVSGTIPAAWGKMTGLKSVSLSGSSVTGCLPDAWVCNLGMTASSVGVSTAAGETCPTTCMPSAVFEKSIEGMAWWVTLLVISCCMLVPIGILVGVNVRVRCGWRRKAVVLHGDTSSQGSEMGGTDSESRSCSGVEGACEQRRRAS